MTDLAAAVDATLGGNKPAEPFVNAAHDPQDPAAWFYPYDDPFPVRPFCMAVKSSRQISIWVQLGRNHPHLATLHAQLAELKAWSTEPLNFSRPVGVKVVKKQTFTHIRDAIGHFMGVVVKYQAVPTSSVSLLLLTNQTLWMYWLSYKLSCCNSSQHLTGATSHCVKVLKWLLATQVNITAQQQGHIQRLIAYMHTVVSQVRHVRPDPKVDTSHLPTAAAVLAWQDRLWETAFMALVEDLRKGPTISRATALLLLDGVVVAWMHNHIPPVRLAVSCGCVVVRAGHERTG
jgi:hypothetical protein